MDEEIMINDVVEDVVPEAEAAEESGIFESAMDADDDLFIESDESAEADQPEEETDAEAEQPDVEEQPVEDADQWLELKHLDEVRKVSKAEAKELAQKGMDYDRIRGKLSDAEANVAKLQKYEAFLNEMKGDFESIDDLIADSRARVLADKENISYEEAVGRVRNNIEREQIQKQAQQQLSPEAIRETMRKESLQQFLQAYPDVKAKDIPQEVWNDMNITNNLVASYAKYEAKKLAKENETLKRNEKNKARSVGSMKSFGGQTAERSAFDLALNDDDY